MTHWSKDKEFWDALDNLVSHGGLPLKNFLDVLHGYRENLDPIAKGILFGGVGEFFKVYTQMRRDTNTPIQSFEAACEAVQSNRLMQQFMSSAVEQVVDNTVDKMEA